STDGGASWAAFGQFCPNVVVNQLRIFNSGGQLLLRASTHGRGMWQIPIPPDFTMAVNNARITTFPGQNVNFSGSLTSVDAYSSSVALSCQPGATAVPDVTCSASPSSVTPTASFSLNASASQAQDYNFNLQARGSDPLT